MFFLAVSIDANTRPRALSIKPKPNPRRAARAKYKTNLGRFGIGSGRPTSLSRTTQNKANDNIDKNSQTVRAIAICRSVTPGRPDESLAELLVPRRTCTAQNQVVNEPMMNSRSEEHTSELQ